jgi:hypothetical protein
LRPNAAVSSRERANASRGLLDCEVGLPLRLSRWTAPRQYADDAQKYAKSSERDADDAEPYSYADDDLRMMQTRSDLAAPRIGLDYLEGVLALRLETAETGSIPAAHDNGRRGIRDREPRRLVVAL